MCRFVVGANENVDDDRKQTHRGSNDLGLILWRLRQKGFKMKKTRTLRAAGMFLFKCAWASKLESGSETAIKFPSRPPRGPRVRTRRFARHRIFGPLRFESIHFMVHMPECLFANMRAALS